MLGAERISAHRSSSSQRARPTGGKLDGSSRAAKPAQQRTAKAARSRVRAHSISLLHLHFTAHASNVL